MSINVWWDGGVVEKNIPKERTNGGSGGRNNVDGREIGHGDDVDELAGEDRRKQTAIREKSRVLNRGGENQFSPSCILADGRVSHQETA